MKPSSEAEARAIGAIFVRKQIRELGEQAEARFLARFQPDEIQYYQTAIASSWVPMEFLNNVYCAAARILFPGEPLGLQKLGESMALNHLTTIYKIFISMGTLPFLVQQAPKIWKCYHARGRVLAEWNPPDHYGKFILEEYPELPEAFRDMLNGYITGVLKLTGKQEIKVVRNDGDPGAWKWIASWKS